MSDEASVTRRSALALGLSFATPSIKRKKPVSRFHCTRCGRAIFEARDLVKKVTLWDLQEYQADCYVIRQAIAPETLTRYDVSLHQGWYCCRFIMMRMMVDKFGTGDALLVYADSVIEVKDGDRPPTRKDERGQVKLGARDFDAVLARPGDDLRVVKFGAIWCPPCRLVDAILTRIAARGGLPKVTFFEVDIDDEPELASRWPLQSIPYLAFYFGGQKLRLKSSARSVSDGVWVGGLSERQLLTLCYESLQQARVGHTSIALDAPVSSAETNP
jgi:thioredoxin 1